MPGPPPKDPRTRQRRNRASTAATLPAAGSGRKAPPLPKRQGRRPKPWHANTRAWWRDVWASPMAARFVRADTHGLYVVVELLDQFWHGPSPELAREIRLSAQAYGLNPLDRRRLQWEIAEPRPAAASAPVALPTAPAPAANDPRKVLFMRGRQPEPK